MREHRFLDSETYLAASNGFKRRQLSYSSLVKIYAPADLRIRVVSCHELLGQSYVIPQVCPIRILSRSGINSLSTRHLKTPFATHSFDFSLPSFSLVALGSGGKPSTWLPPGRLVEHNYHPRDAVTTNETELTYKTNKKNQRHGKHEPPN